LAINASSTSHKHYKRIDKQAEEGRKAGVIVVLFSVLFFKIGSSQAGLQFVIFLPQTHKYWDYRHVPPCLARKGLLFSGTLSIYLLIYLLLCCGYIVTFTKVLTIYHSEFSPSVILLYPSPQLGEV
jgi:hypothetical protein